MKENKVLLSPEDEEILRISEQNYYLLKKFDFILFSNDPRITDPNDKKKLNPFLKRYCNLNDLYHLVIDIDSKLKEAVKIKDIIHLYYRNTVHKNAKSNLENIIILCRTSNIKALQDFSNTLCE